MTLGATISQMNEADRRKIAQLEGRIQGRREVLELIGDQDPPIGSGVLIGVLRRLVEAVEAVKKRPIDGRAWSIMLDVCTDARELMAYKDAE